MGGAQCGDTWQGGGLKMACNFLKKLTDGNWDFFSYQRFKEELYLIGIFKQIYILINIFVHVLYMSIAYAHAAYKSIFVCYLL